LTDSHPFSILLLADIPGAKRLHASLRPDEAAHAIERCSKRMARSIDGYSGQFLHQVNDELLARFTNADEALLGAFDMRQRIADLPPVGGLSLAVRIALHVQSDAAQAQQAVSQLAKLGEGGEILCSAPFVTALTGTLPADLVYLDPARLGGTVDTANHPFIVHRPNAHATPAMSVAITPNLTPPPTPPLVPSSPAPTSERLCLRYRGKSLLLDDKTPLLTLGRDSQNMLVIDDRKASRQHARIERRADGFYFCDNSTNGSYLRVAGDPEQMVRQQAVRIHGQGQLCLGSSCNDPSAEIIEFEPL